MDTFAVLAFGSNIGDGKAIISAAYDRLCDQSCQLLSFSSFYKTKPWGVTDQHDFINSVGLFKTSLLADRLLIQCQKVEAELGRQKRYKWGPREIDIDIIYFGDQIIDQKDLKVPHPFLYERLFVLQPMQEIIPYWIDPLKRKSVGQLLVDYNNAAEVRGQLDFN